MAMFIDGANLYFSAQALGFEVDYKRLLEEFQRRDDVLRAFYYATTNDGFAYDSIRRLTDWLAFNGFTVRTVPAKASHEAGNRRATKHALGVQIAVDAMEIANHVDRIVLFAGDGEFCRLVTSLGARGVQTAVVSTLHAKPPMISDDLRRRAHEFIELESLRSMISRALPSTPGGKKRD
jgi:uncharacterized LabA/DUF88 family protein